MGYLIKFARSLHSESYYSSQEFDESHIGNYLASLFRDKNSIIFLAIVDAEPVGAIAGHTSHYIIHNDLVAFDDFWYVEPRSRGSRTFLRLFKALQDWVRQRGATEITHSIVTGVNANRTGLVLERLGMEHVGGIYKLKL